MPEIIHLPKMSDTMTEGVVAKWHKKVGDFIKSGDLVAEIETDKATMEFESYQEGYLLYMGVEEGKSAPVDSILAIIGKKEEDYNPLLEKAAEESKTSSPKGNTTEKILPRESEIKSEKQEAEEKLSKTATATVKDNIATKPVAIPAASENSDSRLKASPLAKKLAADKGIDLTKIIGSGDGGRVVKRDVDWFKAGTIVSSPTIDPGAVTEEGFEDIPVSQMRKTIARRLAESKFTAPHFYMTMEIVMDRASDARESINAATGSKISINDIVIKAVAASLRQHPKVNSSWLDDRIRINHHIHIGVAVSVDEGLLVPVVRFADSKTLTQINEEVKNFAQKARDKKLQPNDWEGNTFTISNLGMFGIDEFTAIINPPDACILAIGTIKEQPVSRNGRWVRSGVMKVTLSCDHRVVDGVTGAKFLQTLKGYLENPVLLLGRGSI